MIFKVIRDFFSRLAVRLDFPFLTALVWSSSIFYSRGFSRDKKFFIVLSRPGGYEDILACRKFSQSAVHFCFFPRSLIKHVTQELLDPKFSDWNYVDGDSFSKEITRQYFFRVIRYLKLLVSFEGFLSFNIIYHPEKELSAACLDCGKLFVVLQKEMYRTVMADKHYVMKIQSTHTEFKFSKVFVYNAQCKAALLRTGNFALNDVVVVGCPRLDSAHALRRLNVSSVPRSIVYYSVQPNAGFATLDEFVSGNFSGFTDLVEEMLHRFCIENPDVTLFVKSKKQSQQYLSRNRALLPGNIRFFVGGDGQQLLSKGAVVVGLNSTSLCEALASGRIVISLDAMAEIPVGLRAYLHRFEYVGYRPSNLSELKVCLSDLLSKDLVLDSDLAPIKRRFLKKALGNDEGNSSLGLEASLVEISR